MTMLLLLNKIIKSVNIECVICYDTIINSDDLMYYVFYFNYNGNYEFRVCAKGGAATFYGGGGGSGGATNGICVSFACC